MPLLYDITSSGITITGCEGTVSYLQIPETLNALPVTQIAPSAFSRQPDLKYAKLPGSLKKLGRFAFYGCPALSSVSLADGIAEYSDGAFRQCRNLSSIELGLENRRFSVLKDLLADTDRTITITMAMPDGKAILTFPEYLVEYQEDTFARAIHFHIEGAGYYYRECVDRKGIDFSGYDRAFDRIRLQDVPLACRIAMDRLICPYALEPSADEVYRKHLRTFGKEAVREAVTIRQAEWLRLLTRQDLLAPDAVQEGVRLASENDLPDYAAMLMNSLPKERKRKKLEL